MAQTRLLNGTNKIIRSGSPVKLHATKRNAVDYAELGSQVIGTANADILQGQYGTINLLNTIKWDSIVDPPSISPTITSAQLTEIAGQVDVTSKQDTLVSGTSIKTVNNTSLLGAGDIAIEAGVSLNTVKADTDIASSISLKHASGSDNQDLSGLVEKVTGSSLVANTEIAKIHAAGSDNQDLSGKADVNNPAFTTKITTPEIVLGSTPITASADELNILQGLERILIPIGEIANLKGGSFSGNTVVVTDTYAIQATDYTVVCNKGTAFTVTLPVAVVNQVFTIKNIGVGAVTLEGNGADTIDGAANDTLNQWESDTVRCYDANKWVIT